MSARGAVRIPVVAPTLSSLHLAYQLGRKFGVIGMYQDITTAVLRAIRDADCVGRMTSMRDFSKRMEVDVTNMPYTPEEIEEEIIRLARKQIDEEGAQLIYVACSAVFIMIPPGGKERLEKKLGVPILDALEISIRTAEMLVNLKLSHSNIEYPLTKF